MPFKQYKTWKKVLIEAVRAFVPAFLAVIYLQFEAGVNLQEYKSWVMPLLASASLAGIRAVMKWLRERHAKDYTSFLYKLPL